MLSENVQAHFTKKRVLKWKWSLQICWRGLLFELSTFQNVIAKRVCVSSPEYAKSVGMLKMRFGIANLHLKCFGSWVAHQLSEMLGRTNSFWCCLTTYLWSHYINIHTFVDSCLRVWVSVSISNVMHFNKPFTRQIYFWLQFILYASLDNTKYKCTIKLTMQIHSFRMIFKAIRINLDVEKKLFKQFKTLRCALLHYRNMEKAP